MGADWEPDVDPLTNWQDFLELYDRFLVRFGPQGLGGDVSSAGNLLHEYMSGSSPERPEISELLFDWDTSYGRRSVEEIIANSEAFIQYRPSQSVPKETSLATLSELLRPFERVLNGLPKDKLNSIVNELLNPSSDTKELIFGKLLRASFSRRDMRPNFELQQYIEVATSFTEANFAFYYNFLEEEDHGVDEGGPQSFIEGHYIWQVSKLDQDNQQELNEWINSAVASLRIEGMRADVEFQGSEVTARRLVRLFRLSGQLLEEKLQNNQLLDDPEFFKNEQRRAIIVQLFSEGIHLGDQSITGFFRLSQDFLMYPDIDFESMSDAQLAIREQFYSSWFRAMTSSTYEQYNDAFDQMAVNNKSFLTSPAYRPEVHLTNEDVAKVITILSVLAGGAIYLLFRKQVLRVALWVLGYNKEEAEYILELKFPERKKDDDDYSL